LNFFYKVQRQNVKQEEGHGLISKYNQNARTNDMS